MLYCLRIVFVFFLMSSHTLLMAQDQSLIDSLREVIQHSKQDTTRVKALNSLGWKLKDTHLDSALFYTKQALDLTEDISTLSNNKLQRFVPDLKAQCYRQLGNLSELKGNLPNAFDYYHKSMEIYQKRNDKQGIATILLDLGDVYSTQNKYSKSLKHYLKALRIFKRLNNKNKQGAIHVNMGVLFWMQNNYSKALRNHRQALTIYQQLKDTAKIKFCFRNMGLIHDDLQNTDTALTYFQKVLKLDRLQNVQLGIAEDLSYIADIYRNKGRYRKAFEYDYKASVKFSHLNMKRRAAIESSDLGLIYFNMYQNNVADSVVFQIIPPHPSFHKQELLDSAITIELRALSTYQKLHLIRILIKSYRRLGRYYNAYHDYQKAIHYFNKSYSLADSIDHVLRQQNVAQYLYQVHKKIHQYQRALKWHEKYLSHKDSLFNKDKQKALGRLEASYQWQQKQLKDSLQHAKEMRTQKLKHQHQMRQQRTYTYTGIAGFTLMLALALTIYRSYRQKQKSNNILASKNRVIHQHKEAVEQKNEEIISSINYAQYLQGAIFPSQQQLNQLLPEHFILFRPKEQVSGDFYWVENVEDKIYFTVADCTGHGVPGALVSVVGYEALNRCLREFHLREPKAILDQLTKLIENYFEGGEQDIKDGMDLGLCCWEPDKMRLTFAGANNPLYLVSSSGFRVSGSNIKTFQSQTGNAKHQTQNAKHKTQNTKLYELLPNKQPIGKFKAQQSFSQHEINLNKNDTLYLFSDGYPDQFGGPHGKKFMYSQFRQLLLEIHTQPVKKQKEILNQTIENWMAENDEEQIDDICVMGVQMM